MGQNIWRANPTDGDGNCLENSRGASPWEFDPPALRATQAAHNREGTARLRCRVRVAPPAWPWTDGAQTAARAGPVPRLAMAAVAQLAEHLVVIQEVAGSIPVRRPNSRGAASHSSGCRGATQHRRHE